MKRLMVERPIRCLLTTLCALAAAVNASATTYYWDTNGSTAGIGSAVSSADWLTNSWATESTGTAITGAWPNTQPANADSAVFQGTAGTVNISSDVYANELSFLTRDYVIASTGGALHLSGSNPTIDVSLPDSGQRIVRFTAPIAGTSGFTLTGNGLLVNGFKFLQLENQSAVTPNSFTGTLTIAAGGSLRIGGAIDREQIPDDVDLNVAGVIDFVTSGGASDMKQEKVRNVTVDGADSIFSVGNGTDFVVNSIAGTDANNISVNGNQASVPGRLVISGWHDGHGDLILDTSIFKLNTTSGTNAIGGRIVLSGDVISTGTSQVINNNGRASSADTNTFVNKAFDFAGASHTVHVADGSLVFTSASANHPLEITTTQPGGAVVTKTGPGTWLLANATQTNFVGATKVLEGVLSLSNTALADGADLHLSSGANLDLNFIGTDVINAFFIDGVSRAVGTWGRVGHPTANFTSELITGEGLLQVSSFVPPTGDYNGDGTVDAADYTVWRDNFGGDGEILGTGRDPSNAGAIGQADYDSWKANFGAMAPSSGGGSLSNAAIVPEPSADALLIIAMVGGVAICRSLISG